MKKADPLPALLRAFFFEWLVEQRNASGHTVRYCRDTWRLLLRFVAQRHQRTVAQLRLGDLTGSEVGAFLQHTELPAGLVRYIERAAIHSIGGEAAAEPHPSRDFARRNRPV
jgi:hypothetical protein